MRLLIHNGYFVVKIEVLNVGIYDFRDTKYLIYIYTLKKTIRFKLKYIEILLLTITT